MAIGYLQNMPPVTNLHDDGLEHAKQLTTSKKPGCFNDVALNYPTRVTHHTAYY